MLPLQIVPINIFLVSGKSLEVMNFYLRKIVISTNVSTMENVTLNSASAFDRIINGTGAYRRLC